MLKEYTHDPQLSSETVDLINRRCSVGFLLNVHMGFQNGLEAGKFLAQADTIAPELPGWDEQTRVGLNLITGAAACSNEDTGTSGVDASKRVRRLLNGDDYLRGVHTAIRSSGVQVELIDVPTEHSGGYEASYFSYLCADGVDPIFERVNELDFDTALRAYRDGYAVVDQGRRSREIHIRNELAKLLITSAANETDGRRLIRVSYGLQHVATAEMLQQAGVEVEISRSHELLATPSMVLERKSIEGQDITDLDIARMLVERSITQAAAEECYGRGLPFTASDAHRAVNEQMLAVDMRLARRIWNRRTTPR